MTNIDYDIQRVVQDDPLNLGSVRIESGDWAHAYDDFGREYPPKLGQQIMVMCEDGILYWISTVADFIKNWP